MLKRFPGDFASLGGRELIAECDLEVAYRNMKPVAIEKAKQRSGCPGKVIANSSRAQRDQFCGQQKPCPLQTIPDSLPAQTHLSF